MKKYLLKLLKCFRLLVGRVECAVAKEHEAMTDVFEFGGSDSFYECRRCGRDAVTGESFKSWIRKNAR